MKTLYAFGLLAFISMALAAPASAQTYNVTVNGGYGDGSFSAGDTVHVFADIPGTAVFTGWSGHPVDDAEEWHTWFVMPANGVTLTANGRNIPPIVPQLEQIMGRDTLKNLYTYFPPNHKAVVYLFHGTNGSAWGWTYFCENLHLLKHIAADTFAIVITDAEEVTRNIDLNGDQALRWSSDTAQADYENIRIITDTLIARGWMSASDRRIALGMSNGGTFAFSCASQLGMDAVVAFCSQGLDSVVAGLNIPAMWCMAANDAHPSVGAAANAAALASHQTLLQQSICSDYRLNRVKPLHPERFARISGISPAMSTALWQEQVAQGHIDASGRFLVSSDSIVRHVTLSPPGTYPLHDSLSALQQTDYANSIDAAYSDHQMFNDWDAKVLDFLNDPCTNALLGMPPVQDNLVQIYPNPAHERVKAVGSGVRMLQLTGMDGRLIREAAGQEMALDGIAAGIYLLRVQGKGSVHHFRLVRQ